MEIFLKIILSILIIYFVVDVYYRFRNHTRSLEFLLLSNEVVNKTLADKGILKSEEFNKARIKILDNLKITNPKRYKEVKKHLLGMRIDIEK